MKRISELIDYLSKTKDIHGDLNVKIRYGTIINGNFNIRTKYPESIKIEVNPLTTGDNNGFEIVLE